MVGRSRAGLDAMNNQTTFWALGKSPFGPREALDYQAMFPFNGAGSRTVLPHLLAPPPTSAGILTSIHNSVLTLPLQEPSPHPRLPYPELCIFLLVHGDPRCSLVLQVSGPSKSHVRREERRRVTFVGIFNSGENKLRWS